MKLRNKLVAVLAASMVVTSVPVTTMAETTNHVSTSRYAQKGTTFGYNTGTKDIFDTVVGSTNGIGVAAAAYDYRYSNGFEFEPIFDYNQTSELFMSVTKDSNFDVNATLAYVDSFNSQTGFSNIKFRKNAAGNFVVYNANNPDWNGKEAEALLKSGTVKLFFSNTNSGNPAATTGISAEPSYLGAATVAVPAATQATLISDAFDLYYAAYNNSGTLFTAQASVDAANMKALIAGVINALKDANGVVTRSAVETLATTDFAALSTTPGANDSALVTALKALKTQVNTLVEQANYTTTYSQLYRSNGTIVNSVYNKVVNDTMDTVVRNLNYLAAKANAEGVRNNAQMLVKKVENFDIKENEREYKSHLSIVLSGNYKKGVTYKTPLLVKLDGDKTVILKIDGRDSFVTSGLYNLSQDVLTDKRLTVTADDGAKLRTNYADTIGELRFTESQIKSLTSKGNRKLQISLPASSDLEFNLSKTLSDAKVVGKRGFYSQSTVPASGTDTTPNVEFYAGNNNLNNAAQMLATEENSADRLRVSYGISSRRNSYTDIDKQILIIELPNFSDNLAVGEMALSGIYVQPKANKAVAADINVTVEEYIPTAYTNVANTNQYYVEAAYDAAGNYVHYGIQYFTYTAATGYQAVGYPNGTTVNRANATYYVLSNTAQSTNVAAATSSNLIASTTLKVGSIKEYDISLKCDGDPASIKAGRSGVLNKKKTTFILEENVKDSLVDGRKIEFKLENGYMFGPADIDYTDTAANANGAIATGIYGSTNYKQKAMDKFKELVANKTIEFKEKAEAGDGKKGFDLSTLDLDIDQEGRVIGFSGEYDRLKSTEADKIKVTIPVATDVMTAADAEVKVVASNVYTRSFQDKTEDPSATIAKVIAPIAVTFDGAKLKVGKQAQAAGSITIKETDKGMLETGWLFLSAKDQTGISFDKVPTVNVADAAGKQLTVKNVSLSKDKTMIGIELTKASSEASTITISDILLTADRTVPEANYDLAIWGTALTDENELGITNFTQNALYSHAYFNQTSDMYTVKDFVQMTTVNTEDLSNSAKAATATFKIGENKFTVNGETVSMGNATAYIKDNLTFVPVKYVAQSFGIAGNAVQFDGASGTVTIVAGDKVINMTNGKAYITVNGTNVPMQTKAEIKDGRMYVPMAYIASALGVEKSWDAASKTATFTNQKTK